MNKLFIIVSFLVVALYANEFPVYEEILPNKLTLLVVSDSTVPDVSCRLYYFAGSMYESFSHTGLSHFFEHLMFKGTKRLGTNNYEAEVPLMANIDSMDTEMLRLLNNGASKDNDEKVVSLRKDILALLAEQRKYIIKDEIWSLYEKNGGSGLNAWTSSDITAYIVTLPANKVELFANIESDRMQNLVLREFVSERDVVSEERRMRYENRPENNYQQMLENLFYSAYPYQNPVIGWASDIENFSTAAIKNHISKYYRPDNAVIVLAGNIKPEDASELVNKYFGDIKNPSTEIEKVTVREPAPIGEKRFIVRDNAEPRIDIAFHTPGYKDSALFALDIVENMLSGASGILHRRLVEEEGLCLSAGAWNYWRHEAGKFVVYAVLKENARHEDVEKIILEEIAKLTDNEPSADELLRVKNTLQRQYLQKFKDLESFSDELAFFAKFGDWRGLFEYQNSVTNVKSTSWAVKKYLNPDFRTVGWLVNEPKEEK